MKWIQERSFKVEIPYELLREYYGKYRVPHREIEALLDEKAENLENSMNCVTKTGLAQDSEAYQVVCLYSNAADRSIIKREVEYLEEEIKSELAEQANGSDLNE